MNSADTNGSLPLAIPHDTNQLRLYSITPAAVPIDLHHGTKTHKSKKISMSLLPNNDVGQTILDDAVYRTACDIKRHMPAIRDYIDESLGIRKDSWFRPIIDAYHSTIKAWNLNDQEKIQGLKTIDCLVSDICYPGLFYQELKERHLYFSLLIDSVINHEANKFYLVKGSTIDNIRNENRTIANLSTALSRFINMQAENVYRSWNNIYENTSCSPCGSLLVELCHRAFRNSQYNVAELIQLRDSHAMKELHKKMSASKNVYVSLTPKKLLNNLNKRIDDRLQQLLAEK